MVLMFEKVRDAMLACWEARRRIDYAIEEFPPETRAGIELKEARDEMTHIMKNLIWRNVPQNMRNLPALEEVKREFDSYS